MEAKKKEKKAEKDQYALDALQEDFRTMSWDKKKLCELYIGTYWYLRIAYLEKKKKMLVLRILINIFVKVDINLDTRNISDKLVMVWTICEQLSVVYSEERKGCRICNSYYTWST